MVRYLRLVVLAAVVVGGCGRYQQSCRADWLVEGVHTPVNVERQGDELVMENGLIRRTFRLAPNAATVAFDNLMTGESMVRAVKPEASVEIDSMDFNVGGLTGQPDHAYLLDEWLDSMKADPHAFSFVGYEVGPTVERFPWKRVRYCANAVWPARGRSLTMTYKLSKGALDGMQVGRLAVESRDRVLLVSDDMQKSDDAWALHEAKAERSSFVNEGKFGEIYTPANTCVYGERKIDGKARVIQCRIDPGTDGSASWGPGIAVVWADRVVKFYIRAGEGRFGLFDGRGERLLGETEEGKAYCLRVELTDDEVFCDASLDGYKWSQIARIDGWPGVGEPKTVRVGKTSRTGGGDDFSGAAGEYGRCRVSNFAVYGQLNAEATARRRGAAERLSKVTVKVHYEMYESAPVLCKWLTIENGSEEPIRLNSFASEILAMVEYESTEEYCGRWNPPNMYVESDYEFNDMVSYAGDYGMFWHRDPHYMTQVSYLRENPCMLVSKPPVGPDVDIKPGAAFESFRTFEMPFDSTDRERKGLAVRRMYRMMAPWVTENPIMMHVRMADPASVKLAIDQCADVGFEMVILTFGSGFNIENEDPAYLKQIKELVDYAHSKGIELGGYSLLSSRRISDADDVIDVETGKPGGARFGNAPCLGSKWGLDYFRKLYAFFEKTGFDMLEHDGSYPGDTCASQSHPGHRGYEDSQYKQWKIITDFYKWCRGRGVYLNVPDIYYLAGSNKDGMGYRETNWSLPRAQQIIHGRQNIYDGTWAKTPSMGWMFVPLVQYHGGGAAATLEPLAEHLDAYGAHLSQNFGSGVQACYRGPRLYDCEKTREVVKRWVDFYKAHRAILDSDIIHVRRADGRDIDCMMHVNPQLKTKAMALVYNPLKTAVKRRLTLPLYYSGLKDSARITDASGKSRTYRLDRDYKTTIDVEMGSESMTWFTIE